MRTLAEIEAAVKAAGLAARGALRVEGEERASTLAEISTLVLVGMVGNRHWPAFVGSPESLDGAENPLDRYSARVIGGLATRLGAIPLFPFEGPPYLPFQRWAMRAEPVSPSPLGLLIHPEYGLWHSYRGALGFVEAIAISPREGRASPCESCEARRCLSACPVRAFSESGYDVDVCAKHLRTPEGGGCMTGGCLARRACPVGQEFRHDLEPAAFHMAAFLRNRPA